MLCAGLKSFISFCAVSFVQGEGCSAQCKGCSVQCEVGEQLWVSHELWVLPYLVITRGCQSGMFVTVMVVMRRMVR